MSNKNNPLTALSDAMVAAVESVGAATVMVNARRRLPASGIAYAADLILTADHVVERDDDIPIILPDGSQISASVAGRDPGSDIFVVYSDGRDTTSRGYPSLENQSLIFKITRQFRF